MPLYKSGRAVYYQHIDTVDSQSVPAVPVVFNPVQRHSFQRGMYDSCILIQPELFQHGTASGSKILAILQAVYVSTVVYLATARKHQGCQTAAALNNSYWPVLQAMIDNTMQEIRRCRPVGCNRQCLFKH